MKKYIEFTAYVRTLPEWARETEERQAIVLHRLDEAREQYECGMSGQNIGALIRFSNAVGARLLLGFTGCKTMLELIDSIYGAGAATRHHQEQVAEREAKWQETQRLAVEKERTAQLDARIRADGRETTIRAFIDGKRAAGFILERKGTGIGTRYRLHLPDESSSYKLGIDFRRKHVAAYLTAA